MSGGTINHGAIGMNLGRALGDASRGAGIQTCGTFGCDVKIHTGDGRNTYPDVSVICGKPELYLARRDILTNPIVVAEVLSPSTEAYDRSDKWVSYQSIPTPQHYLLLAADRVRVEVYMREAVGWHFEAWEDVLELDELWSFVCKRKTNAGSGLRSVGEPVRSSSMLSVTGA